jgi:hypothetical protein
MTFIPTLVSMNQQLRTELAASKLKEGGHFDTIIGEHETHTTCATCGTVVSSTGTDPAPADLLQAGQAG